MKSGWKTSELWATLTPLIVSGLFALLVQFGITPDSELGQQIQTIATLVIGAIGTWKTGSASDRYIEGRGAQKTAMIQNPNSEAILAEPAKTAVQPNLHPLPKAAPPADVKTTDVTEDLRETNAMLRELIGMMKPNTAPPKEGK